MCLRPGSGAVVTTAYGLVWDPGRGAAPGLARAPRAPLVVQLAFWAINLGKVRKILAVESLLRDLAIPAAAAATLAMLFTTRRWPVWGLLLSPVFFYGLLLAVRYYRWNELWNILASAFCRKGVPRG